MLLNFGTFTALYRSSGSAMVGACLRETSAASAGSLMAGVGAGPFCRVPIPSTGAMAIGTALVPNMSGPPPSPTMWLFAAT